VCYFSAAGACHLRADMGQFAIPGMLSGAAGEDQKFHGVIES
jgi:hypothetical protein